MDANSEFRRPQNAMEVLQGHLAVAKEEAERSRKWAADKRASAKQDDEVAAFHDAMAADLEAAILHLTEAVALGAAKA